MATVVFERHEVSDTPNFSSFVSLWTLSLAPLIAHIVAGVPHGVHLTPSRPTLLQRLVHWNPTSILWRYFAILDRRARARAWDREIFATSNALFWTEHGWIGDEAILSDHRLQLTRMPKKTRIELFSISSAKTLVVGLQGLQALYQLTKIHQFAQNTFALLPMIFLPLALFGLFRLPAALWLTEEYAFADVRHEASRRRSSTRPEYSRNASVGSITSYTKDGAFWAASETQPMIPGSLDSRYSVAHASGSSNRSLRSHETMETPFGGFSSSLSPLEVIDYPTINFHDTSSWRGIAVRLLYLSPTLGILALAIIYLSMTSDRQLNFSATGVSMLATYAYFTIATAAIFLVNIIRRTTRSTVLPGICSMWYKIYTCVLFGMAVAMFIIASLEQIQPPCDGSGNCSITSMANALITFNATSNQDLWSVKASLNASSVMIFGKYTGIVKGTDTAGNSFNSSLGEHWVRVGT